MQVFGRSANSVAKVTLVAIVLFIGGGFWLLGAIFRSPYMTAADEFRSQPVPFSHEHHVGGLGIDCRYCHTSVEDSAFAGIPPTGTCMNCHRQIWLDSPELEPVRESYRTGEPIRWTRVHDLPDFVYFNHSIHVQKGVGCSTCHGRVDRMQLTYQAATLQMQWCLDCHRNPERYVRPKELVFSMDWTPPADQLERGRELVAQYDIRRLTSCSYCHR